MSNCIPSVNSSSVPMVLDSSTVITPSLPTLSKASASRSPITSSRLEIVATEAMSSRGLDLAGGLEQRVADGLGGGVHAALEAHRVGAGGDRAQPLVDHRLGQDRRGGGAVTGDVVGLGGDLLGQLGAEVLERVVELDLTSDGHAVVGDGRRAPLLVQDDVAALGAERHLDGVGERVDAALERAAGVLVELEDLGHGSPSEKRYSGPWGHGERLSATRGHTTRRDQETTARTSRAERMRYSSPPYLTSVPPYLL